MPFRIRALDPSPFLPLFRLPDAELAARNALRVTATHAPGFPCRVSLVDAEPGEELLLVHYEHQPAATPFRASHAIYIREHATQAAPAVDEIPALLRPRTLSVRAFTACGMIRHAEVVQGTALEASLTRLLGLPEVACLHLHSAAMGCYLALAEPA